MRRWRLFASRKAVREWQPTDFSSVQRFGEQTAGLRFSAPLFLAVAVIRGTKNERRAPFANTEKRGAPGDDPSL
jgi:hypothetical protein